MITLEMCRCVDLRINLITHLERDKGGVESRKIVHLEAKKIWNFYFALQFQTRAATNIEHKHFYHEARQPMLIFVGPDKVKSFGTSRVSL